MSTALQATKVWAAKWLHDGEQQRCIRANMTLSEAITLPVRLAAAISSAADFDMILTTYSGQFETLAIVTARRTASASHFIQTDGNKNNSWNNEIHYGQGALMKKKKKTRANWRDIDIIIMIKDG